MWRYSEAEAKKHVRKEVERAPDAESGVDREVKEEIEDRREMDERREDAPGPGRARRSALNGSEPDR